MNKPHWAIGILLLVIAAAAAFLFRTLESTPTGPGETAADSVDYSMERVQVTVFGEDGRPRYRLSSPLMRHFARGDEAQISDPEVRFVGQADLQWRAQAQSALIDNTGDSVVLRGDVVAERSGQSPADYLSLKTDELKLLPKSRRAETMARVQLTSPVHSVTATGLRADFTQQRLELLADVHGTYYGTSR